MLYKIHNGQTGNVATKYLTPLGQKNCHVNTEANKDQFTHTIREWNILPGNAVKAPSHAAFAALVSVL